MANQVTILSAVDFTPPFSVSACNVYGNQCQSIGVISSLPATITLPSQFDTASAVGILLIDSTVCERFETFVCN
jgi:hypothetical protein